LETLTGIAMAVGACGAVFVVMVGIWYLSHRRQEGQRKAYLTRLKQERPDDTRAQFIDWFVARGVRASVAGAVYDYVQQRCPVPDVPLLPEDPLERVSGIVVHEEIDDILHALGYRELEDSEWDALDWDALGLPPPSEPDAPVAALVHLVDALRDRRTSAQDTAGT
jgi:hypothetical protein